MNGFDREPLLVAVRRSGATRVFAHCYMSLPNVREVLGISVGAERYAERSLALACPGDLVCLKTPMEEEYVRYLGEFWPTVEMDRIVVVDPAGTHPAQTPIARMIAGDPNLLGRLVALAGDRQGVCFDPYVFSESEERLTELLAPALGGHFRWLGGIASSVARVNRKDMVRTKAVEMGIPVAPGEVVELRTGDHGRPRSLVEFERAVRRWLPETGKVIIRGAVGSSGSSTFVVSDSGASLSSALARIRERHDNTTYLVEALLPMTVSPNIGMFIDPGDGRISCVSVTDQVLKDAISFSYLGNTYPSMATTLEGMIGASYALSEWLRECGISGHVGFDFCEYERAGGRDFVLAEINPRVNGATYATALMDRLNRGQEESGAPRVEAFRTMYVSSRARTFGELRLIYKGRLFDRESGTGLFPFNTGILGQGRCVFAILGQSPGQVREIAGGFESE